MIVNKRAVFGHATARDGVTWWYATIPWPEQSRSQLAATSAEEWKRRLSGIFAGGSTAVAVIEASGDDLLAYGDYYLPSLPTWHNRSMVVLGDAAHSVPEHAGQGVSMALEDGVELARCLRDIPDTNAAFTAFERLRRPRADRVLVDVFAEMGTPGFIQRLLRSVWTRIRPRGRQAEPDDPVALAQARHQIDWNTAVTADPALERHDDAHR